MHGQNHIKKAYQFVRAYTALFSLCGIKQQKRKIWSFLGENKIDTSLKLLVPLSLY